MQSKNNENSKNKNKISINVSDIEQNSENSFFFIYIN